MGHLYQLIFSKMTTLNRAYPAKVQASQKTAKFVFYLRKFIITENQKYRHQVLPLT